MEHQPARRKPQDQPPVLSELEPTEAVAQSQPTPAPAEPAAATPAPAPAPEPPPSPTAPTLPAPPPPPEAKPPKIDRLGDFRLLKKIGVGGMGTVYKAHQVSLDRDVAVKIMSRHLASEHPSFVQRFYREARLMARLDHPNIVHCYGIGEEHGWHYFAMEYLPGGNLQDWLKRLGRLTVPDALHVVLACARGLQYAHDKGLVHRDIKPANILLTEDGVVRVADLGLAKALDEDVELTRSGTGAGTPLFMSPEQSLDAKHVDARSDIYSLGCMLYFLLTGAAPFQGDTAMQLLEAKNAGKFPPARKANPQVPPRLDLILDKMLANKVEVRYKSCAEVIKDLQGLGLASASLGFMTPGADLEGPTQAPGTKPPAPAQTRAPARPKGQPTQAPKPAPPPPEEEEGPDRWYVRFTTGDGRVVTRQMSTQQVIHLIHDEHFDQDAQASHDPNHGFRGLGTYKQFTNALRGRRLKAEADHKASQFRKLYQQIEVAERTRHRWRWLRVLVQGTIDWARLIVGLLIILVAIGLAVALVRFLIHLLGNRLEAWWQ